MNLVSQILYLLDRHYVIFHHGHSVILSNGLKIKEDLSIF